MPCPYEADVYHACVATRKQSGLRADHAANAHNQEAGATNRLGVFQAIQSAAPWAISGLGGFPGPRGVVACVVWHTKRPPSVSAGSLSSAHAVLTRQCAACHVTQAGFFSEKVTDQ